MQCSTKLKELVHASTSLNSHWLQAFLVQTSEPACINAVVEYFAHISARRTKWKNREGYFKMTRDAGIYGC